MERFRKITAYLLSAAFVRTVARVCIYGASLLVAFTLPKLIGVETFWSRFGFGDDKLIMVSSNAYAWVEKGANWVIGWAFFELALFVINQAIESRKGA